jgi:glycine cleavage system aminomethyltransferase T
MKLNGIELRSDFGDPLAEARSCRQGSALFDFSFIRSARISGTRAQQIVEVFSSRSVQRLAEGKILYAVRADESGRAISDLTIWRTAGNVFEIMSGRAEDVVALLDLDSDDSRIENVSEERAVLAVQGPLSLHVLQQAGADRRIGNLDYFSFTRIFIGDIPCIVGRLGYTGEAGFEVITARQHFNKLWKMLAAHARPAGFIAADMLRIEAGFVLFANEFRLPVSPIEAGLGKFHSGLERSKPELKLITFEAETEALKPLPWQPSVTLSRSMKPGEIVVTSACRSISNGKIIGLGYIPIATSKEAALEDKSGVFFNISQLHMPFYDRQKLRPRTNWLRAANE